MRAALLTCLLAFIVAGCRSGEEPTLGPLPADPREPKVRRIAPGYAAQWTAEGRIVYLDSRDGDVWSIRRDGKRPQRLARAKSRLGVVVSPDGARMLVLERKGTFVSRIVGGRARPVPQEDAAGRPRWSDDGSMLTFERLKAGQRSIWALPARGGRPERLFGEFGGSVLAWASNGRMIVRAFQEQAGGSFSATLLLGSEGEPTEIPDLLAARFLPDGGIEGIDPQRSLVLLDEAGTMLRRLDVDSLPDHSPDGRFLVYEHDDRVWIAHSDWSSPLELAKGPCAAPSFSPDGTHVACSLTTKKGKEEQRYVAVVGVPSELR
jgi:dipeptidyl aminopeptidase/acylaminoacyl peptidase